MVAMAGPWVALRKRYKHRPAIPKRKGAEPLLCPSDYEYHILSLGDRAEGIPNSGQCVKQCRQADGQFMRHTFYKEYPENDSKNGSPWKGTTEAVLIKQRERPV